MGKASSSKKVARAAGTGGGRTTKNRAPIGYYGLILLILALGVAFTITSRTRYMNQLNGTTTKNASVAPKIGGTPWNEGYAVDICGTIAKPINVPSTKTGISTAGNGVIHIAPKVKSAAGKNATLGVFASSVGMKLSASEVRLPGGKDELSGDDCGSKAAQLYIKEFAYVGAPGSLSKQDPTSVPLVNGAYVTIAFVPPAQKSKIPEPPASVQAALKTAITDSTTTTTTSTVPKTTTTTTKATTTTTKGS